MERALKKAKTLDLYKGRAKFIDDRTITVALNASEEEVCISGVKILIAAGGRPFVPTVSGLEDAGYLTSETFFGPQFPEKPWSKLILIGGGPIGCEFAHIFSAAGTKVTVVQKRSRLAAKEEPEISKMLQEQLRRDGVEVLLSQTASSVVEKGGQKQLTITSKTGTKRRISADAIFVSSGIRSNGDRLGLEAAGVAIDARGWIVTDEYLKTSVPHIYALGDINGKFQFRHKANYEADILIHNLFSGTRKKRSAHYNIVPWAIFTHPQIAHVGMTEAEALKTGKRIQVGKNFYSMTAYGYAMGYEPNDPDDGFVKLIADETGKILGVHIIGPHATILIQSFVYLMNAGFTCQSRPNQLPIPHQTGSRYCLEASSIETIDQSMVIHPALSEVVAWVTGELKWAN